MGERRPLLERYRSNRAALCADSVPAPCRLRSRRTPVARRARRAVTPQLRAGARARDRPGSASSPSSAGSATALSGSRPTSSLAAELDAARRGDLPHARDDVDERRGLDVDHVDATPARDRVRGSSRPSACTPCMPPLDSRIAAAIACASARSPVSSSMLNAIRSGRAPIRTPPARGSSRDGPNAGRSSPASIRRCSSAGPAAAEERRPPPVRRSRRRGTRAGRARRRPAARARAPPRPRAPSHRPGAARSGRRRPRRSAGGSRRASAGRSSSAARAIPASSASTRSSSSATIVKTERWWSASEWTSRTRPCSANACPIAAMTAGSRPSETFGTDSRSATDLLYGAWRSLMPRRPSHGEPTRALRLDRARSSAISPAAGAAPRRASRSSPRPSSRARPAGAPTSTGRRPGSSREPKALRGAAGPAARCAAGSSSTRTTFYATFYCASVTRCYPGRTAGRGDRTPTPAEQRLCAPWRTEELRLLRPTLVLTVGGLAARAIVGARTLTECVGKSYLVDDADRDPAAAPVRRERLAQRPGQPRPPRQGAHARPPRDRPARRSRADAATARVRGCPGGRRSCTRRRTAR